MTKPKITSKDMKPDLQTLLTRTSYMENVTEDTGYIVATKMEMRLMCSTLMFALENLDQWWDHVNSLVESNRKREEADEQADPKDDQGELPS